MVVLYSGGDLEEIPFAIEPVIGFRRGINEKMDIGFRMHGVYYPQFVFDFKHVFYNRGDFYFSGDLAIMGMHARTIGPQYDFLFGREGIYGTCGYHFDIMGWDGHHMFQTGIGGMNVNGSRFGWQVNIGVSTYYFRSFGAIRTRVGFVYNLVPKKFRRT
jgi:hypothetical protein